MLLFGMDSEMQIKPFTCKLLCFYKLWTWGLPVNCVIGPKPWNYTRVNVFRKARFPPFDISKDNVAYTSIFSDSTLPGWVWYRQRVLWALRRTKTPISQSGAADGQIWNLSFRFTQAYGLYQVPTDLEQFLKTIAWIF